MQKLLLIFIHGIGGDSESWGAFGKLISSDPDISAHVEIAFFEYPTALIRRPIIKFWSSLSLQDLANALCTEIDNRFASYDRILLVCHSMGGLIAKRYIVETLARYSRVRVTGAVFFATPHTGATLATAANFISKEHRQAKQLRIDSDFLDLLARDWANNRCEERLQTRYVVGGQDNIVDRSSAAGPSSNPELIADKAHRDIVKPTSDGDLSFLIVKNLSVKLLRDELEDFTKLRSDIQERDEYALIAHLANRGRSWIETASAAKAVPLLQEVVTNFPASSQEVIWARYLLALSRLFLYGENGEAVFDDKLLDDSKAYGLDVLLVGERMEFARKRGENGHASEVGSDLLNMLMSNAPQATAGASYAWGTANYLLANLYRYGGQYGLAKALIDKAQIHFRPTLLSHQIELAHCQYGSAICNIMEGIRPADWNATLTVAPELRFFSEALMLLCKSHALWSARRSGEAIEMAEQAAQIFDRIQFSAYRKRAVSLANLIAIWKRLELGAAPSTAAAQHPEFLPLILALLGAETERATLFDWIEKSRPSRVLGMLQFASAYSENWSQDIGEFKLPSILSVFGTRLSWTTTRATSLAQANNILREQMKIPLSIPVPLIAD